MVASSVSIGTACSCSRSATAWRPRCQVHMPMKSTVAMASGTQPPSANFSMLAENSEPSTTSSRRKSGIDQRPRPLPAAHRERQHQHGGDQHGAGDGDAVGRGDVGTGLEGQHDAQHARELQPVHGRHVDLAELAGRGVQDAGARADAQQGRLLGHREGARDRRLRGDHRRHGGDHDQGIERPVRRQAEERVGGGGGIGQQQRALAVVVGEQGGEHHDQPGGADRDCGRNGRCRRRAPPRP